MKVVRLYTIAEEELAYSEAMNLLEAEPASRPAGTTATGPDFPAQHEHLAMLVSTGKAKNAIGVQMTRAA